MSATWRARLDDHLGNYTVEPVNLRAAGTFAKPHAIYLANPNDYQKATHSLLRSADYPSSIKAGVLKASTSK